MINTKGPSASGKSTLRLLQRKLASDIGVDWRDIALISPDIWRKQLLDYGSLGPVYKYAGAFTGEEVQIVDQKLDRYMARKHRIGHMPHLLIDRFRFDSFAPGSDEAGSNLLTRFGQTVYLFFVITPPELLVERAWKRGLEVGRYKAVDDTLAHSVEAYTGMPDVFFTWARRRDKRLQFEFLDNTVRLGDRPRTIAFGDSSTFNVLDVGGVLNIERYGRIDVDAQDPESIYPSRQLLAPEKSCGFLGRCLKEFRQRQFCRSRHRAHLPAFGRRPSGLGRPGSAALGLQRRRRHGERQNRGRVGPRRRGAAGRRRKIFKSPPGRAHPRGVGVGHFAPGPLAVGSRGRRFANLGAATRENRSIGPRAPRGPACAAASSVRPARYRASPTLR